MRTVLILITLIGVVMCFREKPENQYFIMSTSKFWFNVRQGVNSLMIYQALRELGVKDENILLMIPEETACNSKNNLPGMICPFDDATFPNVYRNVELDYKKNDASVFTWINIFRGKYGKYTPRSRRLKLNNQRKFISFANGHGGDGYMKMQDTEYILDFEMTKVVKEMRFLDNYKEAFFISDSCSAVTLYEQIHEPNTLILGSSSFGQKSYSHGRDNTLLIAKSDKFSLASYKYLTTKFKQNPRLDLAHFMNIFDPAKMKCDTKLINNLVSQKNASQILMSDYFSVESDTSKLQYKQIMDQERMKFNQVKQVLFQEMISNLKQIRLPSIQTQMEPVPQQPESLIFQL